MAEGLKVPFSGESRKCDLPVKLGGSCDLGGFMAVRYCGTLCFYGDFEFAKG